jgi:hypothetical protein
MTQSGKDRDGGCYHGHTMVPKVTKIVTTGARWSVVSVQAWQFKRNTALARHLQLTRID